MKPAGTNDLDAGSTDPAEEQRQRIIDRAILVGVMVGPLLLAGATELRRFGAADLAVVSDRVIPYAIAWVGMIATQMLIVWSAWRSPVLGAKPGRGILVIAIVLGLITLMDWYAIRPLSLGQVPPRVIALSVLYQRLAPFAADVISLVIVRRVIGLHLVRAGDQSIHQLSRISIRECLIWTFVIALVFSFVHHVTQWFQSLEFAVFNHLPWWYSFYFLVAHLPASVFLVVSLALLHMSRRWRWLPIVIAVFWLISLGQTWITHLIIKSYFGFSSFTAFEFSAVLDVIIDAGPILIATWLLHFLGFRFVRATR